MAPTQDGGYLHFAQRLKHSGRGYDEQQANDLKARVLGRGANEVIRPIRHGAKRVLLSFVESMDLVYK